MTFAQLQLGDRFQVVDGRAPMPLFGFTYQRVRAHKVSFEPTGGQLDVNAHAVGVEPDASVVDWNDYSLTWVNADYEVAIS